EGHAADGLQLAEANDEVVDEQRRLGWPTVRRRGVPLEVRVALLDAHVPRSAVAGSSSGGKAPSACASISRILRLARLRVSPSSCSSFASSTERLRTSSS